MSEPSSTQSLPYTRGYDRVIIDSHDLAQTGRVSDQDLLLALSHIMSRSVDNIRHRLEYLSGLDEQQTKRIRLARYPSTIDWESLFTFLSDKNWDSLKSSSNSREDVWVQFDPIEDVLVLNHVYTSPSLHDAIELLGQQYPHRLKRNWQTRYALLKSQYTPSQLETRMEDAQREFQQEVTLAHFQTKFPRFYSTSGDETRPWFDEDDKEDDEGDADGPSTMFSSSEDKLILDTETLLAEKGVADRLLLKILEFSLSIGPHTIRKHLAELRQEPEMVTLALKESSLPENVNWKSFSAAIENLASDSTTEALDWPKITESVEWNSGSFSEHEDRCLLAHLEVAATIFDGARAVHRKYPHKTLQQWHKRYYVLLAEKGRISSFTRQAAAVFSEVDCEERFLSAFPDVYEVSDGKFRIRGEHQVEEVIPEPVAAQAVPIQTQTLTQGYDTSKFTRTQDKVIYAANKTATENNVTIEVLVQTVSYVLNRDPELVRQRLVTITTEMSANEIARLQRHNYPYGIDWHQIKDFLISAQSKPKEAVDWDELYTRSRAFNVKKRLDDKERKALLAIAHSEKTPIAAMTKLHSLYPHRSRHAWSDSWRILKNKPNYQEEVRAAMQEYDHEVFQAHFKKSFPEYYGAKEVVRTVVDNNHNPKGKPRAEGSRYPLKPLKKKQVQVDEPNAESEKSLPVAPSAEVKKPRKKRTKLLKDEAEQLRAEDLIRTVVQDAVDAGNVDPQDPAAADGLRPRKKRKAAAQIGSLAEEVEEEPMEMMMDLSVDSINEEDLLRAVQNATELMEPNVVDVAVAAAAMSEGGLKKEKDTLFVPEVEEEEEEEIYE